jgi:hypothetical protein
MGTLVAFDLATKRVSASTDGGEKALFADLLTDTLYAVVGTTVVPLFQASAASALYKTGVFVADNLPSFSCLQIEGDVVNAVARMYADGALIYTTPALNDNAPVRVPKHRGREWALEVESAGRVTGVVLASSIEELR